MSRLNLDASPKFISAKANKITLSSIAACMKSDVRGIRQG